MHVHGLTAASHSNMLLTGCPLQSEVMADRDGSMNELRETNEVRDATVCVCGVCVRVCMRVCVCVCALHRGSPFLSLPLNSTFQHLKHTYSERVLCVALTTLQASKSASFSPCLTGCLSPGSFAPPDSHWAFHVYVGFVSSPHVAATGTTHTLK